MLLRHKTDVVAPENPNGYRCHATTGVTLPLAKLTATR